MNTHATPYLIWLDVRFIKVIIKRNIKTYGKKNMDNTYPQTRTTETEKPTP